MWPKMDQCGDGDPVQGKDWTDSQDAAFVVEGERAYPARMLDDFVKHIFREHNQEADHLAMLETGGQRNITTEGVKNAEAWKAERGCCW